MKIRLDYTRVAESLFNVAIRCPHCGHYGTFKTASINDIVKYDHTNGAPINYLGIRRSK